MARKQPIILFVFLFLVGTSAPLHAIEYRRLGQDYRSLAMGNTGIASANTSAALFYNPAAMANITTWWMDFPFVQAAYSDDAEELYEMARDGAFDLETQEDQIEFMNNYIGKNPYIKVSAGANMFINMDRKGMTVGGNYTYEATLDIEVSNPSLPEIQSFSRLDHIRQGGISIPIGLGKLVLGLNYKVIERQELGFTFDLDDALAGEDFPTLSDDAVKGSGTGYDIGFLYRLPSKSRIMIGGVWRSRIDMGDATDIPEELALGAAMTHNLGIFRTTLAMDWRDITNKQGSEGDTSLSRRLHYGLEIGVFPISNSTSLISLRSGCNQGYCSTENWGLSGIELALGHNLILGYTKYTEETGEYAGQSPSERTIYYLSFGF